MSIYTSTKHRMLLDYNRKRKQRYDDYMVRKTQKMQAETDIKDEINDGDMDAIDVEVKHLYKKLGEDHKNKDVRKKIVHKLTSKPENTLSPSMWIQVNPAYRIEKNDKTHFADTFKGKRDEDVDKVYFRRKDNLSDYAEALFKTKLVLTKK